MVARKRRARVTGLGGIFFKAKDPKALVQWYRRHLGMDIEDTVALFTWRGGKDGKARGATVWSIFPAETKLRPAFVGVGFTSPKSEGGPRLHRPAPGQSRRRVGAA